MVTAPGFSSPNQPDQKRTTAYRDSSGPNSRSDAHYATIVGDWEEPSGESRLKHDQFCRKIVLGPGFHCQNQLIGRFLSTKLAIPRMIETLTIWSLEMASLKYDVKEAELEEVIEAADVSNPALKDALDRVRLQKTRETNAVHSTHSSYSRRRA